MLTVWQDPFDIWGIIKKKDQKNRYWLRDGIGGPLAETQPTAEGSEGAPEIHHASKA